MTLAVDRALKPQHKQTKKKNLRHYRSNKVKYRLFRHSNNSNVNGPIWPEFELIRDFMAVLVTCKFDEDPIKSEVAIVWTTLSPL